MRRQLTALMASGVLAVHCAYGQVDVPQAEITIQYLSFPVEQIDQLLIADDLSLDSLRRLRQEGAGELVAAAIVTTRLGEEAYVKVVRELIYPVEYDMKWIQQTTGTMQGVSGVGMVPEAFETREVGSILSVLADLTDEEGVLTLVLTPQAVTELEPADYSQVLVDEKSVEHRINITQPVFWTREVSTRVSIVSGSTLLVGGAYMDSESDRVEFTLVKAQLRDGTGHAVGPAGR